MGRALGVHGALVEDGFVVLGGPLDEETAMLLVEAADEDEVRSRLAEDPWKPMGMLETGEIRQWTLWLDSRGTWDQASA